WLHQVSENAGLDGAGDELVLPVGGQHHDRDRALGEDPAGGLDPVEARHLHVEDGELGLRGLRQSDGFLAVSGLGADLVPRALENVAEVEADDRLVLGDEDSEPRRIVVHVTHCGKVTSAVRPASPESDSSPLSSSFTSARTIESPVPSAPGSQLPLSATVRHTAPFRRTSSTCTSSPPCSRAFCRSSLKTSASAVARPPCSSIDSTREATCFSPASPWTIIARRRSTSSPRSTSSSRRSVRTSWTAAIARMRLTESASAFSASVPGARDWRRRSEATVC